MVKSDKEFRDADYGTRMDFTATTTTELVKMGYKREDIEWYEFTSAATLVPYGSELSYTQAPIDAIMFYKHRYYRYFELKGRTEKYPSTYKRIMEEGSFCNQEKIDNFKLMENGKIRFCYYKKDKDGNYILNAFGKPIFDYEKIYDIPIGKIGWAELYVDDVVRIWWNLADIGLDTLNSTEKKVNIKEVQIDPDSNKKEQRRGYLQVKDAKEYKRIKGS